VQKINRGEEILGCSAKKALSVVAQRLVENRTDICLGRLVKLDN
jgi:hypothetical protein